jgi:hypothetical protein
MTRLKDDRTDEIADRTEIDERIAEADRNASKGIGRYRQGDCLHATVHAGEDQAAVMEKALAEHVAAHPEDAGRTVADFKWIVWESVSPLLTPRHLAVGPKSSRN